MPNSCKLFDVENIIIKRKFMILLVSILLINLASSIGNWGDINSGDNAVDDTTDNTVNDSSGITNGDNILVQNNKYSDDNKLLSFLHNRRYTYNFYIALGVSFFGIIIMFFFFYLFIRNPKNKWNKKTKKKHIKRKN